MSQSLGVSTPRESKTLPNPTTVNVKLGSFEQLLDLREAATVLGMHWKTLEGMARGKRVPALKVGKRWKFRLSALDAWLEDGLNSRSTNHAALTGQEQIP